MTNSEIERLLLHDRVNRISRRDGENQTDYGIVTANEHDRFTVTWATGKFLRTNYIKAEYAHFGQLEMTI